MLSFCPDEEARRLYVGVFSACGRFTYDMGTVVLTEEALSLGGPFLRVHGEDAEILLDAVLDEFF